MSCQQIGVHNNMKFDCSIVLLGEFCFSMILSGNWNMKDSPQDFSTFWRYGKFLIDGLIDWLLACLLSCLLGRLIEQTEAEYEIIHSVTCVWMCWGVPESHELHGDLHATCNVSLGPKHLVEYGARRYALPVQDCQTFVYLWNFWVDSQVDWTLDSKWCKKKIDLGKSIQL